MLKTQKHPAGRPTPGYDAGMAEPQETVEDQDDDDRLVRHLMRRLGETEAEVNARIDRWVAGEPMTKEEVLAMEGARITEDVPTDRPPRGLELEE